MKGPLSGKALREAARKRMTEPAPSARGYRLPTSFLDTADTEERDELIEVEQGVDLEWGTQEKVIRESVIVVVPGDEDDDGEEMGRLCRTLGLKPVATMHLTRSRKPDPATYIGQGAVEQILQRKHTTRAEGIVIDGAISPAQMRNLEDAFKAPVFDREGIVLAIFRQQARTKLAQLQVELAHLKYMQPRLAGQWMGLSRQRGGRGGLGGRGLGETRLELDRRVVKDRITLLTKKLREAEKAFRTQSARRSSLPRVALVGYTNAGKSTLMQALTGAPVLVEDKLFSTLDTTVRPLQPPSVPQILVSDTVGFVKRLPHNLVASFKNTLREASESTLILHVIDLSQPDWRIHFTTTEDVLQEIGCEEISRLLVLNKTDRLDLPVRFRMGQVTRFLNDHPAYVGALPVSALEGEGVPVLRDKILELCRAQEPSWRQKDMNDER